MNHFLSKDQNIQEEARRKIGRIKAIYKKLSQAPTLLPSKETNALFHELVSIVLDSDAAVAEAVMDDAEIKRVRPRLMKICSEGEYLLEMDWAQKVLRSPHPRKMLTRFPYYKNYLKIAREEARGLRVHAGHLKKMLFIGSGPLPLSAILMAERSGWTIDAIDSDAAAQIVSSRLIRKLGLQDKISVQRKDIRETHNLSKYRLICIAALVGNDEKEKQKIVERIQGSSHKGALILLRSASDMGTLLYPQVRNSWLARSEILEIIHPARDVINPVVFVRTTGYKPGASSTDQKALRKLLRQYRDYRRMELRLQSISDSMMFADPLTWIMYKHAAYKGSGHAILTVGELREHCSEPGDICAKRFDFLRRFLKGHYGIDIADEKMFPSSMPLQDFYRHDAIRLTVRDRHLMKFWERYEYFKRNGKAAKWENYSTGSPFRFL